MFPWSLRCKPKKKIASYYKIVKMHIISCMPLFILLRLLLLVLSVSLKKKVIITYNVAAARLRNYRRSTII